MRELPLCEEELGEVEKQTPYAQSTAFIASLNKLIKDTNDAWKLHKDQLGRWTEEGGREKKEESPKAPTE